MDPTVLKHLGGSDSETLKQSYYFDIAFELRKDSGISAT